MEKINSSNIDITNFPELESQIDSINEESELDLPSLDQALHQPTEQKEEKSDFDVKRKAISSKLSPIAYVISSAYHVFSGLGIATGLFKSDSSIVKNATRFTKLVNSLVYGDLAIDAWKNKNTFDLVSRVLEPTLNCFSQLYNYHLLRGLGSAMTQLHVVNLPFMDKNKSHWENFIENLQESKRFLVESLTSPPLGPNRKLFKGRKDEGHTLALLSFAQGFSSMLGLLNGNRRNLIDKIVGSVRNAIGIGVDLDLLCKKDPDEFKVGLYYLIHAVFDTVKRFLPKERADILDNLIMPLYNKAMYHFGRITRRQSEGTYVQTVEVNKNKQVSKEKDFVYNIAA